MALTISKFPENIQLKLYEKLSATQLCRVRATCKGINDFVEEHRFDLSKKRKDSWTIVEIHICSKGVYVLKYRHHELILEKPFEQLSALAPKVILSAGGKITPEKRKDIISYFRQMRLCVEQIAIEESDPVRDLWIEVISLCSFTRFITNPISIGIAQLFSIKSIQNAHGLIINTDIDSLDILFLRQLEKVEKIAFCQVMKAEQIILEVLPQLMKDACNRNNPLEVQFMFREEDVDLLSLFPNVYPVYRKSVHTFRIHEDVTQGYAQGFPENKIFLLFDYNHRCWAFHFVNKDKKELKDALQSNYRDRVPKRLLDGIFAKIVAKGEAPILVHQPYLAPFENL